MRRTSMAGLDVVIDGDPGGRGPVVVLLHGFGAPGDDLVPLGRALRLPSEVRFLFPAAPLGLPELGVGRAWWRIDLARMMMAQMGEAAPVRPDEVPEGLAPARARVLALLDEVDHALAPSRLVLGGFSQGAMLSLDVALRSVRPLAGLALMSGTLLAEQEWAPRVPTRRGLPVFLSHGAQDPLLPFAAAERLRDLLAQGGLEVEWVPFRGGHEIPYAVLERLARFLDRLLG